MKFLKTKTEKPDKVEKTKTKGYVGYTRIFESVKESCGDLLGQ